MNTISYTTVHKHPGCNQQRLSYTHLHIQTCICTHSHIPGVYTDIIMYRHTYIHNKIYTCT